eukprot:366254-Chlamydomonas_euryale.AAC.1
MRSSEGGRGRKEGGVERREGEGGGMSSGGGAERGEGGRRRGDGGMERKRVAGEKPQASCPHTPSLVCFPALLPFHTQQFTPHTRDPLSPPPPPCSCAGAAPPQIAIHYGCQLTDVDILERR